MQQGQRVASLSGLPTLLVMPYANPAVRELCEAGGIGYLDTTGWVRLLSDSPALFITAVGAARDDRRKSEGDITRLNGVGASRLVRALCLTQLPIGVRALAAVANVSPGTVSKVLPTLEAAGAVERDEAGAVTGVRARLLLERWTQDYGFLSSNPDVGWFLSPRGLEQLQSRLADRTDVAATASLAARRNLPSQVTSVTPLTLAALYALDPAALADELGLVPQAPASANVVLVRPSDPTVVTLSPYTGFVPTVDLPLLLADLRSLPGRFQQEAEQLMDVLARTDMRWS